MKLKIVKNLMAPMRDGVLLSCDIYRPDDEEKYPSILMRTPYLKDNFRKNTAGIYSGYEALALSGYNIVVQDVRGTGNSGGILKSTGESEFHDGYDTVEWIAGQSWCDGKVGMYGLSYFGYTQLAAAEGCPPHLYAICPFQNASLLPFSVSKSRTLGGYHLYWLYGRAIEALEYSKEETERVKELREKLEENFINLGKLLQHLPLRETPGAYVEEVPLLQDFIELVDNTEKPEFWKRIHRPMDFSKMNAAMFHLSGWFDMAKDGTIDNYIEAKKKTKGRGAKGQKLVIGPWVHGESLSSIVEDKDYGAENSGEGQKISEKMQAWFHYWLKDDDNGIMDGAEVSIFVLGANVWREEKEWPIARTVYTNYYIHSKSGANSLEGDGVLSLLPPEDEIEDCFIYDPENPFPSSFRDSSGKALLPDLTEVEKREDVLIYSTPVLEESIEVTGNVTLKLYASTDAVDTDFACRLVDVFPDGRVFPLTSGIVRAKFRNPDKMELLIPGQVYEYEIEVGNISNMFLKGHKIRIEVSSSFYPAADRNLNTGEPLGAGIKIVKARQTVFHNREFPSRLILPIIPIC